METAERCSEHTRRLPALVIGNHVRVQNQTGPHTKKWDETAIIIEVLQFDQYRVPVPDGSGRITLRNRKFQRKRIPVHQAPPRYSVAIKLPLIKKISSSRGNLKRNRASMPPTPPPEVDQAPPQKPANQPNVVQPASQTQQTSCQHQPHTQLQANPHQ